MTLSEITDAVDQLADDLAGDIILAKTREEHIRVSARAAEARRLARSLAEAAGVTG